MPRNTEFLPFAAFNAPAEEREQPAVGLDECVLRRLGAELRALYDRMLTPPPDEVIHLVERLETHQAPFDRKH